MDQQQLVQEPELKNNNNNVETVTGTKTMFTKLIHMYSLFFLEIRIHYIENYCWF